MYHSIIKVTLRKLILDPAGKAVENALHSINYNTINNVRIGKFIEMDIDEPDLEKAKSITDEVSKKVLSNPIMEDYSFEIEKK
jgi:phosphoribosylformylglycinamidine synthase subunit PurS